MMIQRPEVGGVVPLTDEILAKIGLAACYDSTAKAILASALRALTTLDTASWVRLERQQISQIIAKIQEAIIPFFDSTLNEIVQQIAATSSAATDHRNMIMHAVWAEGVMEPSSWDYRRVRMTTTDDVQNAVELGANLRGQALNLALYVASMIEQGILTERSDGAGMSIRTPNGLVRL